MASRLRSALRPPRKLRFTRDGKWFVGMTILVGVGAVNTGNNLLYLLLGMMLGLIIVSGILSERVLRGLEVKRGASGDVFAGKAQRVRFEVTNTKRWFSSYSITVREHESRETRARRRIAIGLPGERPRRAKERQDEGDPGPPSALAIRIPPKKRILIHGETTFPRRGLYHYVGLDVETRFPFGFFEKSREVRQAHDVLVYPEIRRIGSVGLNDDPRVGEVQRQREGRSGDFFGLIEFRDGDDRRDVHWKVTARRGQLVKRLYERQDDEAIALYLLNWAPPAEGEAEERAYVDEVEEAIITLASIAAALTRAGRRFSVHSIDERVSEGSGAGQLQSVLRHLALLKVRRDAECPWLTPREGTPNILVAPRHSPHRVRSAFDQQAAPSRRDPVAPQEEAA